jgi:hypothetical protein
VKERTGATVAFSLGTEATPSAGPARARLARTLGGAVARGVTVLDVSESPSQDAGWALAREGAGPRWSMLTVFLAAETPGPARAPSPGATVVLAAPHSVVPNGEIAATSGVRFDELGSAEAGAAAAAQAGAAWVSLPGSLIDAPRLIPLVATIRAAGASVLLTNPHADGRLDGQWLSEGLSPPARAPRPVDLADLERSYAPVLALRFLTERRRRTLPQAAVAFALALGAVPSVRFRDLAQVEAFGNADQLEPLTEAELGRLARG